MFVVHLAKHKTKESNYHVPVGVIFHKQSKTGKLTMMQTVYHGLYGSTSCCISHGPSQWERAIFDPPQLGDLSTDFHET